MGSDTVTFRMWKCLPAASHYRCSTTRRRISDLDYASLKRRSLFARRYQHVMAHLCLWWVIYRHLGKYNPSLPDNLSVQNVCTYRGVLSRVADVVSSLKRLSPGICFTFEHCGDYSRPMPWLHVKYNYFKIISEAYCNSRIFCPTCSMSLK